LCSYGSECQYWVAKIESVNFQSEKLPAIGLGVVKVSYKVLYLKLKGNKITWCNPEDEVESERIRKFSIKNLKECWGARLEFLNHGNREVRRLLEKYKIDMKDLPKSMTRTPKKRKRKSITQDGGGKRAKLDPRLVQRKEEESAATVDVSFTRAWEVLRRNPNVGIEADVISGGCRTLLQLQEQHDYDEQNYDLVRSINKLRLYNSIISHTKIAEGVMIYTKLDFKRSQDWPPEIIADILMPYNSSIVELGRCQLRQDVRKRIFDEMPRDFFGRSHQQCLEMMNQWLEGIKDCTKKKVNDLLTEIWKKCNDNKKVEANVVEGENEENCDHETAAVLEELQIKQSNGSDGSIFVPGDLVLHKVSGDFGMVTWVDGTELSAKNLDPVLGKLSRHYDFLENFQKATIQDCLKIDEDKAHEMLLQFVKAEEELEDAKKQYEKCQKLRLEASSKCRNKRLLIEHMRLDLCKK